MAKKFCLPYFPFVPSQSSRGGGGGSCSKPGEIPDSWPFSDSPVDYFDNLGIVDKLTLIFCLY